MIHERREYLPGKLSKELDDCANSKKKALECLIVAYLVLRISSFRIGGAQLTPIIRVRPSTFWAERVRAGPQISISDVRVP